MIGPQPRTSTEKGKTKEEEWVKKKRKKQQHNGENILSQTSQGVGFKCTGCRDWRFRARQWGGRKGSRGWGGRRGKKMTCHANSSTDHTTGRILLYIRYNWWSLLNLRYLNVYCCLQKRFISDRKNWNEHSCRFIYCSWLIKGYRPLNVKYLHCVSEQLFVHMVVISRHGNNYIHQGCLPVGWTACMQRLYKAEHAFVALKQICDTATP